MILIITHRTDYTADYVINLLNKRSIPYYRFNCEDINNIDVQFSTASDFNSLIERQKQFKSVWFRRTKLPILEGVKSFERLYLLSEYESLLTNLWQTIDASRWLSCPDAIYRAENKFLQLKIAHEIGFNIPDTLISLQKDSVRNFVYKHNFNVILKPLSSGKLTDGTQNRVLFTNKVKKEHIEDLENFDVTPVIFQEYIEKDFEIRVTIINDKVFAARVNSQSCADTMIDWRRKKLKFQTYVLPSDLAEKCVRLLKVLNLAFGAIDLVKSTDGQFYFLEINPNGQWAWIDIDTDMGIADEIIKFLIYDL